jgi:hypothetical protein
MFKNCFICLIISEIDNGFDNVDLSLGQVDVSPTPEVLGGQMRSQSILHPLQTQHV